MVGALLGISLAAPSISFATQTVSSAKVVQSAIQSKKAGWTARESWVTRLPHDQLKRMLGLKHVPSTDAQFSANSKHSPYAKRILDAALDWRNKDGVNWVSPVLNQGNCGSCVAFSSVATLETQVNITSGIPGLNPKFSTQDLFNCGGASCDQGWEPGPAADYIQNTGVTDEACMPYTSGASGVDVSCDMRCADASSRAYKIVSYTSPSRGYRDINAVKAALANGPVVTTLTVYSDFLFYSSGVYKHVTGDQEGGHAVSIVGYDDASQSWIVRNSWGSDWGNNGFVNIAYDDTSGVSDETWQYTVPQAEGYVAISYPQERDFISGNASFAAKSTFPNTSDVTYTVKDSNSRGVTSFSCAAGSFDNCQVAFDSTKVADGQYEVVATATYNGQKVDSQHAVFYVLNHTPTSATLNITGADNDLTQPLTGRVVINVDAVTGAGVPFNSMTFHAAQNGKDVYTKLAPIVIDKMTLGWRTGSVPNGSYDIYFTGDVTTVQGMHFSAESAHTTVQVAN
jgi:C1A family cysteine protease